MDDTDDDNAPSDAGDSPPDRPNTATKATQPPTETKERFALPANKQFWFGIGVSGSLTFGVVELYGYSIGENFVFDFNNAELRVSSYTSGVEPGNGFTIGSLGLSAWAGAIFNVGSGDYTQGFFGKSDNLAGQYTDYMLATSISYDDAGQVTARSLTVGKGRGEGLSLTGDRSVTDPLGEATRYDLNLEQHILRWMESQGSFHGLGVGGW